MQAAVVVFSAALLLQCIGCSRSSPPAIARLSAQPSSTYALLLFAPVTLDPWPPASPSSGSGSSSGFRIIYWRMPNGEDYTIRTLPANARSYVIRHLQPGSEYVVRMAAVDGLARGPYKEITMVTQSDATSRANPFPSPVNLHVDVISANTVHVTWENGDPQADEYDDGREYSVLYHRVGQSQSLWSEVKVTGLQITITQLEPNMPYVFMVKVVKGYRQSQFSMPVIASTLEGQ